MSVTVYVPRDSSALAVGAEALAEAIQREAAQRGVDLRLARNGSRGLFWLEPLVEVATPAGRIAYGPVRAQDVPELFDAGFLAGGAHPTRLGPIEQIPYLQRQQRLTCARIGLIDPLDLDDYLAHGGYRGLHRALEHAPEEIVAAITASGLRGRGGAAFPAGIKWNTVREAPGNVKYVVANADEGDSGSFADRLIMEGDPFALIEGMTIAALAVGATQGYIYLRVEYPHAHATLERALATAYRAGYLGADVAGSGKRFDLEVRLGAGAYVCGEETALLESLEGKRGMVRSKPPLPALRGLFGQPTLVNNVLTLATVPYILAEGAEAYQQLGAGRSRGTLPIQLAGNIARPGLIEQPFGISLREILYDYGGGSATGRPLRAVQVGGPLGAYVPAAHFDLPLDYEVFAAQGAVLGHGSIVAFDDTVDMARMARHALAFCAAESCGKCTPCRLGSTRGVEVMDDVLAGRQVETKLALLRDLGETMRLGSLCALGGMTPYPVLSALEHFPEDFTAAAARSRLG
ncbi:formate dehydrogenase beta subunit [Tepidiphilus olei]|uniref:formate dehydrogenase beta subunit n=1 Tax=Tepidiphilus olei TaxID=2502184 RepID=UPI00115DE4A5|nr:formate dehydrogenase beta subunit [Tepidiphilus olei]